MIYEHDPHSVEVQVRGSAPWAIGTCRRGLEQTTHRSCSRNLAALRTAKRVVYTYPSKKALTAIIGRVRALTRRTAHPSLAALLRQLNPALLGWCTYFRHGVSKATFGYLDEYTWRRVTRWIRKRYRKTKWVVLFRRFFCPDFRRS